MFLQEVQQSDTRADSDGEMLTNSGYRSQPVLDDVQNKSAAARRKTSRLPNDLY